MRNNRDNQDTKRRSTFAILFYINRTKIRKDGTWKSHATLTPLAKQDCPPLATI